MIIRAKLKVLFSEFPGLEEVVEEARRDEFFSWGKTREENERRFYTYGAISVQRADLAMLEKKPYEYRGGFTQNEHVRIFALGLHGQVFEGQAPSRTEIRKGLFRKTVVEMPGERVRDLILRTDPEVIVYITVTFLQCNFVIYKPRKGMTLRELAQKEQQVAELEVQEEIAKVDEESADEDS